MKNTQLKQDFNPNGIGLKNGNFIGLPFTEKSANVVLLPVPWDVTVSYGEGTALAPHAILEASSQLDLYDHNVQDAWKLGIFMLPVDDDIIAKRNKLRPLASEYTSFLENDGDISTDEKMKMCVKSINLESEKMNDWVFEQSLKYINKNKLVGIVGGDHSVPLGYLRALASKYSDFGVLHIDAHHDLRNSYEGLTYSHASIFNNALHLNELKKLVQVGIRDYCQEDIDKVDFEKGRIKTFYDPQLKENRYNGLNWEQQCKLILENLPRYVYVSFDVDGLDPKLCPNTGTPVPGGLEYDEAIYLVQKIVSSGRKIIGFDVCEVGNSEWDANVGARIIYKICNLMGKSQGRI